MSLVSDQRRRTPNQFYHLLNDLFRPGFHLLNDLLQHAGIG